MDYISNLPIDIQDNIYRKANKLVFNEVIKEMNNNWSKLQAYYDDKIEETQDQREYLDVKWDEFKMVRCRYEIFESYMIDMMTLKLLRGRYDFYMSRYWRLDEYDYDGDVHYLNESDGGANIYMFDDAIEPVAKINTKHVMDKFNI
jgi:hypothetical protein